MLASCLLILLASCIPTTEAWQREDDFIASLPGLDVKLDFKQYSGYLQGKTENVQLHYWLVEATADASTKPLVLWLNGGPGCSSLLGLLNENGPVLTVPNNKLKVNPFSWNRLANVLYLEAPAGVGFSYAVDKHVKTDDDLVSENNYAALLNFMKKFPEYQNRDFFITGESYGGVYVPTLALRVVDGNKFNLKGIAVGNGLLSYLLNDNSLIYFGYHHGLFGDRLWNDLVSECCGVPLMRCMFTQGTSSACKAAVFEAKEVMTTGFNLYNLYTECAGGVPPQPPDSALNQKLPRLTRHDADLNNLFRSNPLVQLERASQSKRGLRDKLDITCTDDSVITSYLNDSKVREALHIPTTVPAWETCSGDVYFDYGRIYEDLSKQYMRLLEEKIRVTVFNGDVDMACNFLGDEWFINNLNLPLVAPRHAWFYNATDGTRQIGGFTKTFALESRAMNVTYLTVKGSGHMVPQDAPCQAYALFQSFLQNLFD